MTITYKIIILLQKRSRVITNHLFGSRKLCVIIITDRNFYKNLFDELEFQLIFNSK